MAVTRVRRCISIKTSFVGFHRWPSAPPELQYLAHPHRHQFGVEASVWVGHADREVEFHTLRRAVDEYCLFAYSNQVCPPFEQVMHKSCEMIAEEIADMLKSKAYDVAWVGVDEDGENKGFVIYDQDFEDIGLR